MTKVTFGFESQACTPVRNTVGCPEPLLKVLPLIAKFEDDELLLALGGA